LSLPGFFVFGDDEFFFQGRRLLREIRNESPNRIYGVAKFSSKIIERSKPGTRRGRCKFFRTDKIIERAQPQIGERTRQRRVVLLLLADDVDVLQASVPIDDEIGPVFSKKLDAFAKKKKRDQAEHDHRHQGVTTEERSKQFFAEGAEAARDDGSYALMPLIISVWKRKP